MIIPSLNEAATLASYLPSEPSTDDVEWIVVDGGSRDGTAEVAAAAGCKLCRCAPGRARQMNAGAEMATGGTLLFLHADTILPPDWPTHVRRILSQPGIVAGAFRLRLDSRQCGIRTIERLANWRSLRRQRPYGDQAIFLRAERFRAVGGYAKLPIMEDVELVRRLCSQGRIGIAPAAVLTSGRRWVRKGVWRTTLQNQLCLAAYHLGVDPARIHGWYYGESLAGDLRQSQSRTAAGMEPECWGARHGR